MIVCSHFAKIKQDKIANLANGVKRVHFCQSHPASTPQDPKSQEIWVCLDCGNQACSKYSAAGCALKHSVEQRHRLAIGLKRLMVFCFECNHDLQSSIDEQAAEGVESSPQAVKLQNFIDKVKQLFFKLQTQITAGQQPQNNLETLADKPKIAPKSVNSVKPLVQIPSNVFGLVNLGNTCFFNSVIQCLNGCRELINEYNLQDFQGLIEMHEEIQDNKSKRQVEDNEEDDGWVSSSNKKTTKKFTKQIDAQQFLNDHSNSTSELPPKMINQLFQRLLSESRINPTKIFNPSALYAAISQLFGRFKTLQQQDAHDLLRCLLDGLIVGEEKWFNLKKITEKKQGKLKNFITENIFGGYLSNFLKCLECSHVSRTFEFFLDLALPIASKKTQPPKKIQMLDILGTNEEDIEKEKDQEQMQEKGKQDNSFGGSNKIAYQKIPMIELEGCKIPYFNRENESLFEPVDAQPGNNGVVQQNPKYLTDLLKDFFNLEQLTKQTNYYRCEKCGQSSRAERKFFLYENPKVLTLVLKRFVQTSASRFEKVNTHVEIPETISIAPYTLVKNPDQQNQNQNKQAGQVNSTYELFGVVVHEGSMLQGHYVTFVKHLINGENHWFYYSDEHFYETTWENVKASQAYILFFRKTSL